MNYELPTEIVIGDEVLPIRKKGDYRVILDVLSALTAPDLDEREQAAAALSIFYETPPHDVQRAAEEMVRFIDGGEEARAEKSNARLMDWEQDFPLIVAPVNRILGCEIRSLPYLHWWSFLSAYMEIGDCTFSTVVSIRQKKQKGKKLEKWEQDYVREHPDTVNLAPRVSQAEKDFLDSLVGD